MINVCGLDFGTSNTISTVFKDNTNAFVPLEGSNHSLPSSVFFPFENLEKPLYGGLATETYMNDGYGRYMKSFKRILGTSFFEQGTFLKPGYKIKFHDIIVDYIKHVKNKTEDFIDAEIDHVLVGKPVRLAESDDTLNSGIAQLESILLDVGYKNYSFVEEPIAAAYYHKKSIESNSLALVADLGGGTCDFTIVEVKEKENDLNILSTSGISLGGTDIDSIFALDIFFPELGYNSPDKYKGLDLPDAPYRHASDWNAITTQLYSPKIEMLVKKMVGNAKYKSKVIQLQDLIVNKNAHSLLGQIEDAKINLSEVDDLKFKSKHIPNTPSLSVSKKNLNESIEDIVEKIVKTSLDCCDLAGVDNSSIDYLILTGGTSKTPLIKNLFTTTFNKAKLIEKNSMASVALGLLEKAKRTI